MRWSRVPPRCRRRSRRPRRRIPSTGAWPAPRAARWTPKTSSPAARATEWTTPCPVPGSPWSRAARCSTAALPLTTKPRRWRCPACVRCSCCRARNPANPTRRTWPRASRCWPTTPGRRSRAARRWRCAGHRAVSPTKAPPRSTPSAKPCCAAAARWCAAMATWTPRRPLPHVRSRRPTAFPSSRTRRWSRRTPAPTSKPTR